MSIIHFSGTTNLDRFVFGAVTHTMIAGVSGATSGKSLAPSIGSIDPIAFPDTFGRAIFDFRNNTSGQFEIAMDSGLGLNPDFWKVLKFSTIDGNWDRQTFTFDQFAFSENGATRWLLNGQPSFLNGVPYLLDWT